MSHWDGKQSWESALQPHWLLAPAQISSSEGGSACCGLQTSVPGTVWLTSTHTVHTLLLHFNHTTGLLANEVTRYALSGVEYYSLIVVVQVPQTEKAFVGLTCMVSNGWVQ